LARTHPDLHNPRANFRARRSSAVFQIFAEALIWNDAIAAAMRLSRTTHVATGTVPSVSLQHVIAGASSRLEVCCRCLTPMWSSLYPNNWRRSHVLPAGFVKIRHFGLLANRNRRQALALSRLHLRATAVDLRTMLSEQQKSALNRSCPQCKCGTLRLIARDLARQPIRLSTATHRAVVDSS
jgi:hypothetical protein